MPQVRVLIADDNDDYRSTLGRFVSMRPDMLVVASATDGAEAVASAIAHRPDVALLDLMMPAVDGFEAIRRLRAMPGGPGIVALTAHRSEDSRRRALAAGADAFIQKHEVDDGLIDLIRALAAIQDRDAPRRDDGGGRGPVSPRRHEEGGGGL